MAVSDGVFDEGTFDNATFNNVTRSDSISLTDAASNAKTVNPTPSLSLNDVQNSSSNFFRLFSNTLNFSDSTIKVFETGFQPAVVLSSDSDKTLNKEIGENTSVSDAVQAFSANFVGLTEAVNVADSFKRISARFKTLQDSLTVQEADVKNVGRQLQQNLAVSSQESAFTDLSVFNESLTVAETEKTATSKTKAETVSTSDTETAAINKVLKPSITLSLVKSFELFTSVIQTLQVTDVLQVFTARFVNLTEQINTVDLEQVFAGRKLSQPVVLGDAETASTQLQRSENVAATDVQSLKSKKTVGENIVLQDSVLRGLAFAEQATISDQSSKFVGMPQTENVSLTESRTNKMFKPVNQSVVLNDAEASLLQTSASEDVTVLDDSSLLYAATHVESLTVQTFFQPFTLLKNLGQPVNVDDVFGREADLFRQRTQKMDVADVQSSQTSKTKSESISASDGIRPLDIFLTRSENVVLTDVNSSAADLFRGLSEKPVLQTSRVNKFITGFEETVSTTDSLALTVFKEAFQEQISLTDDVQAPKGFFPKLSETITVNQSIRSIEAVRGRIPDVVQILNHSLAEAEIRKKENIK